MILTVLACLNVLFYGAAGTLIYVYVLAPPTEPTAPLLVTSAPTLRPTFTPTWTSTPRPGTVKTRVQSTPFPVRTYTPATTSTSAPRTTPQPVPTDTPTPLAIENSNPSSGRLRPPGSVAVAASKR